MQEKGYQETKKSLHDKLIFKEKLVYIIAIPLLGFFLSLFVFHFYHIDGPSMEQTLWHNDRVVIEKTGKTWSKISGEQYVPDRYEVVVFESPGDDKGEDLIKRVVALPGERVVVLNNDVRVYNQQNPEGFLVDEKAPSEAIIGEFTSGYIDLTVGPDEVFVLGDNREASFDSRNFGTINTDKISGTLVLRVYPFKDISFF